jgi:hypothetical protein
LFQGNRSKKYSLGGDCTALLIDEAI